MTDFFTLKMELLKEEEDCDQAQRMIDHGRKTILGQLPWVKNNLNSHQIELDYKRARIVAARQYIETMERVETVKE